MQGRKSNDTGVVGWLSSLAIHLALANVLVLWMASRPARQAPLVIEFSASVPAAEGDLDDFVPLAPQVEVESTEELRPIPLAADPFSLGKGRGARGLRGEAGGPPGGGSQARYFGVTAAGDRFVYALDISTSMDEGGGPSAEGSRFERATAELLRSVEALSSDQQFYVFLFCYRTRHMFDKQVATPRMVPATEANKRRLREWLSRVSTGGGTDPRTALFLALKLRPSAIFLLSDGEFNGRRNGRRFQALAGNPSVTDVVAACPGTPSPIHAIAYEDQQNRQIMSELAEQTSGSYRFIPSAFQQRQANALLRTVRKLEARGELAKALERYQRIVTGYGDTQAAEQAESRIAALQQFMP